jgi:hypothetical protein
MGAGRRAVLAALALVLAIAPGGLRLLPSTPSVERASAVALDRQPGDPLGHVAGAEVAIQPPGELVGAMADPGPPPPVFEATATTPGQVFALVIGIDDYPGTSSDLRSAVADADLIDAALDGFGVPASHRVVLRDGQARRAEVAEAVAALAAQGGPGTTLVLAYAGHTRKVGPGREAIVLADGETLTDEELAGLLAPATAQQVWLLLATCFAGGFTELLAPGRILTGAADATSLAYESPALHASYLVHHLVREGWLQGQAGRSVQEAFRHADEALAATRPERRPVQVDEHGQPLVLGTGDPSAGDHGALPAPDPAPVPAPGAPPTTTTTAPARPPAPRPEQSCLLGLLCSG